MTTKYRAALAGATAAVALAAGCAPRLVAPSDARVAVMGRVDRADAARWRIGYSRHQKIVRKIVRRFARHPALCREDDRVDNFERHEIQSASFARPSSTGRQDEIPALQRRPIMEKLRTRWMTMAGLLVVAAVVSVNMGCSSSNGTVDSGTGGKADSGSGSGGSTGAGGAAVPLLLNYTFDTSSLQMWAYDQYVATTERNLGYMPPADAGAIDAETLDGGIVMGPTLTVDSAVGSPAPGSLEVTVIFTDCAQYVDPVVNLPMPLNLTGKTIHAQIRQTSGGFSGGAQLHASSGAAYVYVASPITFPTTPATFTGASLDLTTAVPASGTFDPTAIVQVGIKIFSGYAPTCVAPYANAGETVVFNIDTVTN